jgi:hypothetical protein
VDGSSNEVGAKPLSPTERSIECDETPGWRGTTPPVRLAASMPTWRCPIASCDFELDGTVDEPFEGDGTCRSHPDVALVLDVSVGTVYES